MIPYGRQDITNEDIEAVVEVLKSDFITQGPAVVSFEKAMSDYTGTKYAVAVNSATSALHIACLALGLEKDDWLWTSPNTFVASANCGLYCGAKVDFVDIDSQTYNMCVEKLEEKLLVAQKNNKLPKVIVPVHFAGQSCDMEKIHELSLKYGFKIIEDASHAVGGRYLNRPVGSCKYSDITVFSFHPVKIITTAEGGMALTNNRRIAEKMERLRSHGITRDASLMEGDCDGPWYYQQIELGFNYRMTDIQAVLGTSQLKRIDEYINKRHIVRSVYDKELDKLPLTLPAQHDNSYSALHLYPVQIKPDQVTSDRKEIFVKLREAGIGVNIHYIPVHTQPYYRNVGFKKGDFPVAENYYSNAISLPMFPTITEQQISQVITVLSQVVK